MRKMSIQEEDEARGAVASTFFEHLSLVENQLQSFNEFLEDGIHEMFRQVSPIEIMPDQNPTSVRTSGYPAQARFCTMRHLHRASVLLTNQLIL